MTTTRLSPTQRRVLERIHADGEALWWQPDEGFYTQSMDPVDGRTALSLIRRGFLTFSTESEQWIGVQEIYVITAAGRAALEAAADV